MVSSVRHELMCESFWELRIPSRLELANDVVERFVERVEACGVSGSESLALRHGIHEAMANAILHGNGGDSSRHVRVAYGFCGNEVWIEVEDEGPGFRAERVEDPRNTTTAAIESRCVATAPLMPTESHKREPATSHSPTSVCGLFVCCIHLSYLSNSVSGFSRSSSLIQMLR
jgi:anti-sigma regulatory factor (Ser/Thr protein kinase)